MPNNTVSLLACLVTIAVCTIVHYWFYNDQRHSYLMPWCQGCPRAWCAAGNSPSVAGAPPLCSASFLAVWLNWIWSPFSVVCACRDVVAHGGRGINRLQLVQARHEDQRQAHPRQVLFLHLVRVVVNCEFRLCWLCPVPSWTIYVAMVGADWYLFSAPIPSFVCKLKSV